MDNHSEGNHGHHNTYHETKVDNVGTFCPAATHVVNHNNYNLPLPPKDINALCANSEEPSGQAAEVIVLRKDFNFDEIHRKIAASEEVLIFGLGCTVTINLMYDKYINLQSIDQHISFLFMDSEGCAVKIAAYREGNPVKDVRKQYRKNWSKIQALAEKFPGKIHFKKIDYLPPYNLFIFNPGQDNAELYVHIAGWKSASTDGRPLIVLHKQYHSYWFQYFLSEFKRMWNLPCCVMNKMP